MYLSKAKVLITVFAGFLMLGSLQAAITAPSTTSALPRPSKDLSPEEVVNTVISALSRNDVPHIDAGIETTFNFASPENRVNTGPLDNFTRMVKAHPYGVMVNHRSSDLSETVQVGTKAYILVQLTTQDGSEAVFAFRLSKQRQGEYQDMWMTDAVWPVSKNSSF